MTLTQAEMESRYDATRLSPLTLEAAEQEEEDLTIPPELADDGQAMLGHTYGDVMLVIDKRDGGMVIARRGEIGGRLLERDEVIALTRFFQSSAVSRVVTYHWGQHLRASGSPELVSLLDWMDAELKAEEAAAI